MFLVVDEIAGARALDNEGHPRITGKEDCVAFIRFCHFLVTSDISLMGAMGSARFYADR